MTRGNVVWGEFAPWRTLCVRESVVRVHTMARSSHSEEIQGAYVCVCERGSGFDIGYIFFFVRPDWIYMVLKRSFPSITVNHSDCFRLI